LPVKCLDTDLLIGILRGKEEARQKMEELDLEGRASTTSVNALELFYGAYKSREKQENVTATKRLLWRLDVLPFDSKSSEAAGETLATLAGHGEIIDYRDAMIAAIAKVNGLTLVTRNKVHFSRIMGLELEVW
jgi:tRNA(fMet)-specific endonuclease VapC